MSAKQKIILAFLLILWVSACAPKDDTLPEGVASPITIQLSTSLTHWLPKLNTCATALDETGIVVNVIPYLDLDFEDADLTIYAGVKPAQEAMVSLLSIDSLAVIVNTDNPLSQLSTDSLANIYSGSYANWSQVPETLETGDLFDQPIKVFVYGSNSDFTETFKATFMDGLAIRADATYSPSWETMLNSIGTTPGSIGFVLASQLDTPEAAGIPVTKVTLSTQDALPVIAVYTQAPEGKLRQLLLCLQSSD